jgi:hypothetical protein
LRAELAPVVESGEAICWRCGELIEVGQPWDLGHDDEDRRFTADPTTPPVIAADDHRIRRNEEIDRLLLIDSSDNLNTT